MIPLLPPADPDVSERPHIQSFHKCKKKKVPIALLFSLFIATLVSASSWPYIQVNAAPSKASVAQANNGQVTGNAFADYNADGIDAGLNEHGIPGILVQAYDVDNKPLGAPVSTDINGDYVITGLTSSQQIRVEFSLPPELSFMRAGAADPTSGGPGATAAGSSSTVAFATEGDADINVGFNNPADYCQANPDVAISCFVFGPDDGPNAGDAAMVKIPFDAQGDGQDQTTKLNSHQDVGTVYGIAYQKTTEQIYAAAYLKRFTDFGPGGPDAIYQLNTAGGVAGTINLSTLTGTADSAGADPHDFTPAPGTEDLADNEAYSLVGKSSLGDIEISDDMTTLYVVNMFDRKLYALDISSGDASAATVVNSWDAPNECGDSEHRPMALAWRNEKIWIGSTCENISGAYVHSLDPTSTAFELEVTVPLDYTREQVLNVRDLDGDLLSGDILATWNAWSDDPTQFGYSYINEINGEYEITYPQPMLSDIEFDGPHMILGFRDRFGDQTGFESLQIPAGSGTPDTPADRLYDADAVGDILRVCSDGAGDWIVETGDDGDCSPTVVGIGPQPDSGPSGLEYYYWDNYPAKNADSWAPNLNIEHYETSQGSLLQVQGSPSIMLTAMDPFQSYSAGILRLDNITGQRVGISADDEVEQAELTAGAYELYNVEEQPSTFGKANGLGDIEAMCILAPIEIGNYVWLDTDGDGIQDPDEAGIPNVTVELYEDGVLIGETTTNENGQYLFGGPNDTGMNDGPLLPDNEYEIRIPLDDANLPAGANPTQQDYNDDADNGDIHDADGDNGGLNDGYSTIEITTGAPGENDHTFDFGFTLESPEPGIQLDKTVYLGHDSGAGCPAEDLAIGAVGGEVTYCFVVTNIGGTYLNDITIDDATLGIARDDMTFIAGEEPLAPGATISFYYETTIAGPLVNTANTSGTPTDAEGNPIPGLEKPTDEDDAEVRTPGPDIQLEKTVYADQNGGESCPGGELANGMVGGNVTYCFVVTNTGDTYLNDITIDDTTLGITRADMTQISGEEPLEPGKTLTFYYETTITGPLVNTANTSGTPTDAEGNPIPGLEKPTDEDDAEVQTPGPAIQIDKTVYLGHDGGASCPGDEVTTDEIGGNVTYCFVVTNTGDTYLDDIEVNDDTLSITRADLTQTGGQEPLEPGKTLTFYYETTIAGPLINTADTTGTPTDADGNEIPGLEKPVDDDDAEVKVPEELAAIGDLVWLDTDADGIQDEGELGLPGVIVTLYDENDMALSVTVTDGNGNYLFENLQPGTYSIGFKPTRPGFEISPQNVGDDATDSDADPETGRTEPTELLPGETDLTWDVGISGAPRMLIDKDADIETVQPNQRIVYTIVYTNTGNAQATNVTITEIVPEYSRFLPGTSSPEWECEENKVSAGTVCTANVGNVLPNQSNTVDLRFAILTDQVIPETVNQILNIATITQDEPAGQGTVEHTVEVFQPTAIDAMDEPSIIFTEQLYMPFMVK